MRFLMFLLGTIFWSLYLKKEKKSGQLKKFQRITKSIKKMEGLLNECSKIYGDL